MPTMIDAKGWNATFKTEHGYHSEPLVCWVLEDHASRPVGYYVYDRTGKLSSAEEMKNFNGYSQDEEYDAVIVPAEPGWWTVERDSDAPDRGFWTKVLAWRIFAHGDGVKAVAQPDADGFPNSVAPEQGKLQFVFDPLRPYCDDGPWPTPEQVTEATA